MFAYKILDKKSTVFFFMVRITFLAPQYIFCNIIVINVLFDLASLCGAAWRLMLSQKMKNQLFPRPTLLYHF